MFEIHQATIPEEEEMQLIQEIRTSILQDEILILALQEIILIHRLEVIPTTTIVRQIHALQHQEEIM